MGAPVGWHAAKHLGSARGGVPWERLLGRLKIGRRNLEIVAHRAEGLHQAVNVKATKRAITQEG